MSKQSLTREEIAYLLRGIGDGSVPKERRVDRGPELAADPCLGASWQQTAEELGARLAADFQTPATVEPQRNGRATQGQFLLCCQESACLYQLAVDGVQTPIWLSIDLPLMFSLLDRLLGGQLAPHRGDCRPLTELENRLATRIIQVCVGALEAVWPGLSAGASVDAGCRLQRPWLTSPAPYACCELSVQVGEVHGVVSLAIPWQLARGAVAAPRGADVQPPEPIVLTVVLGRTSISSSDLAGLEVGDLIPAEQRYDDPLEIQVGGQTRYRGRLGSCQGQRAIRIE